MYWGGILDLVVGQDGRGIGVGVGWKREVGRYRCFGGEVD